MLGRFADWIRRTPTLGDRIAEWDAMVEREAMEQHRRVKALEMEGED